MLNLSMIFICYDPVLVDIKVSRMIGVAPLGVNFSAGVDSSSVGNRPFHERFYSWDFGDPTSGIWPVSEKSKNTANGPVSIEQIEIMVQDPDEIYSGGNTNERNIGHSIEGPVTIGAYGTRLNPDERGICVSI